MELNQAAREETIRYHESYYSSHKLFEEGWLTKPDEEINRIVSCLSATPHARVLDIGCGVGRNAIPIARELKLSGVVVDCYDMLDSAIEMLTAYAAKFDVAENIAGKCVDIDSFEIQADHYDAMLAISVLEHSKSVSTIESTLEQMVRGTRKGGVNRITISTDRRATECGTGTPVNTHVETPMTKEQVKGMLEKTYSGWTIDRLSLVPYKEDLELDGRLVTWTCTDVSFLARKA